jgi:hypothetical protein
LSCCVFYFFGLSLDYRSKMFCTCRSTQLGRGCSQVAAFALVVSAVVALSVAVGFADNIKHDFEGWETGVALYEEVLRECQKEESLTYTIVAAGFGEAYESLKPPIDSISYLRPVITILYLIVAASFFMAAVDRRKWVVFSLVLFAAVIATGANFTLFKTYLDWNLDRSGCTEEKLGELARARMGESLLRRFAADLNEDKETNDVWDISYRAEGRTLLETYRFKKPITDFYSLVPKLQKLALESYCAHDNPFLRNLKATRASLYYSVEGERLTSFSISPADCPQW